MTKFESYVADVKAKAQKVIDQQAEIIAEMEALLQEAGAGKADEARRGATGSATQMRAEPERPAGMTSSQQPTRPAPSDFSKLAWKTNRLGQWAFADDPAFKELAAKIGTGPKNSFTDEAGFVHTITVGDNGKRFLNRDKSK